jgi:hypothetical protein
MPYTSKKVGDQYCVYKHGEKVGCTDGNKEALRKYMAALHINSNENVNELKLTSTGVKDILKAIFNRIDLLPKLGFRKFKDAIEYLKDADLEEQDALEDELKRLGVNVVYEQKESQLRKLVREEVRRALKSKKK